MDLPHHEHLHLVPAHLTTRAGLKKRGLLTHRPEPVATVTSYGKTVFLYDLRPLEGTPTPPSTEQDVTPGPPRTRKRVNLPR